MRFTIACILAFFSGVCALAYETLWNRILANALGDTVFNSAVVIVIFFVGMSAGALVLRLWRRIYETPWLVLALLEASIAAAVLPTQMIASADYYPGAGIASPLLQSCIHVAAALILVGPPAFCMGGTLLALIEAVAPVRFAGKASVLYGLNTVGGIAGIAGVTFFLVYIVGIQSAVGGFMKISMMLAVAASLCHVIWKPREPRVSAQYEPAGSGDSPERYAIPLPALCILSAISGTAVIGFEILFMHTFALVGHNSAWSFAVMLMIVIGMLGVAALLASIGAYRRGGMVRFILPLISVSLAAFPHLFYLLTGGMQFRSGLVGNLGGYLIKSTGLGLVCGGPFLLLCGLLFPWVIEAGTTIERQGKRVVGALISLNAAGAVAGAVAVEFVLLPMLGIWRSFAALGCLPVVAWFCMRGTGMKRAQVLLLLITVMMLGVGFLRHIPPVRLVEGYKILETKTGVDGVVCVKEKAGEYLVLSVNNNFRLSSAGMPAWNQAMGHIPLLLHPHPEKVAFIGLATGLTASSAVQHRSVSSITVVDNSPLVIELSLKYFGAQTGAFHTDPRVRIVEADGVNFMATVPEKYDVIVGDLFFPWNQGAYRLYTREHFLHVRSRLTPDGIFCQWLPLYQFDYPSLVMVVRTFESVFPEGIIIINPSKRWQQLGLLGINSDRPVDRAAKHNTWMIRLRQENGRKKDTVLEDPAFFDTMYVGRISDLVSDQTDLNTMDMPLLEERVIRIEPTLIKKYLAFDLDAPYGPGVTLRQLVREEPCDRKMPEQKIHKE